MTKKIQTHLFLLLLTLCANQQVCLSFSKYSSLVLYLKPRLKTMAPFECPTLMVVSLAFPRMRDLLWTNTLAYLFIMSFTKNNVYYNHKLQHNLLISALFCQLAILSTYHFVNLPFFELAIFPTCHFVNLPFSWTCYFSNLLFFQPAIFPTCHFANLPFCQLAIFMNLLFFQLVVRDKHFSLLFWGIIDWEESHPLLCGKISQSECKSSAILSSLV